MSEHNEVTNPLHADGALTPEELAERQAEFDARLVRLDYTNHRGERRERVVYPMRIRFDVSEHHPGRQWLMDVWDAEKDAPRTYALSGLPGWALAFGPAVAGEEPSSDDLFPRGALTMCPQHGNTLAQVFDDEGRSLADLDHTEDPDVANAYATLFAGAPRLHEACRSVVARLDYLRGVWGDEGVTRGLRDRVASALAACTPKHPPKSKGE